MPRQVTHRTPDSKRLEAKTRIIEILRTVPHDQGFHFYTGLGYFTGETATSLDDFSKKLQVVAADSVIFHFQRSDFQKWIEDTIGDKTLAERISFVELPFSVEELRKELQAMVKTRIAELKRTLPHSLRHIHS